jgi:hypothetical protein
MKTIICLLLLATTLCGCSDAREAWPMWADKAHTTDGGAP